MIVDKKILKVDYYRKLDYSVPETKITVVSLLRWLNERTAMHGLTDFAFAAIEGMHTKTAGH